MIDIKVCPSTLAAGYGTYSTKAIKHLFGGVRVSPLLDFGIDEFRMTADIVRAVNRISVSGAQEKFPAVIENGKIRLTADDETAAYILKPAPWDETISTRKQIPANENLTMQIASQVYGIRTAANGLCFSPSGETIYITKRFDIAEDGTRYGMEDFASLAGKGESEYGVNYKYDGCYEDIARAIRKYIPAWPVAMEEFFRVLVFNYIYGNGDAHLKNFSIMKYGDDYRLAPAYDLLNTSIHIDGDDFGLTGGLSLSMDKSDVYARTGHPCRTDFERFGRVAGLKEKRMKVVLDAFSILPQLSSALIGNSYLTDKMKRSYLRVVNTRLSRFNRPSE